MITHPVAPTPDPSQAISPPAIAGPMTRPRLNDAELSPTAFGSWSRRTISWTNAWRAGVSIAVPMPNRKAIT